jgi:hypothetical protein
LIIIGLDTTLLAKRIDEGSAQAENFMFKCNIHENCPNGYHKTAFQYGSCLCFYFGGGWKRDTDLVSREEGVISRIPFDPHVYCANTLKGKCPGGTTGLWHQTDGRCYCGSSKAMVTREDDLHSSDLKLAEEAMLTRVPFDPKVYCANTLKDECPGGTIGLWSQNSGRCYCGAGRTILELSSREEQSQAPAPGNHDTFCAEALRSHCPDSTVGLWSEQEACCYCYPSTRKPLTQDSVVSVAGNLTTTYELTKRLLPKPLKFPSNISSTDYTAILGTLILLDLSIKSQDDLHQICTGAEHPQVYGFKLDIFLKLCTPEITIPVVKSEIIRAQQKVLSLMWIDTALQKYDNDFELACAEARLPDVIPSILATAWIMSKLCHPSESVAA